MGNLGGESREQNRKDKLTRFPSVTYARSLGLLVNTLGSLPEKLSGIVWTDNRYVTLLFKDLRGAASLCYRNCAENTVLICEQKPYPVWFSYRLKTFPV